MYEVLKRAAFLVFPSHWYEALPRIIVDSYAVGTPVLAAQVGAMRDLIHDGRDGLHFRPGDASHLAEKAAWLFSHRDELSRLRSGARAQYLERYTAERNYELLMDVYLRAMARHAR